MSEQEKKPAHEVLLDKLAIEVAMLPSLTSPIGYGLFRIKGFCEVLAEMIIPENHRAEIVGKLREFLLMCPESSPTAKNILSEAVNFVEKGGDNI